MAHRRKPEGRAMQAGWIYLILSMRTSRPPVNWWRVGGLGLGVGFCLIVWALLVAALR
jgi:hypothetical protein